MTIIKFFALVGIFCAVLQPSPTFAESSDQLSDTRQNYVVIGAFRYHRNATRFTNHAHKDLQLNAKYEMNQNSKLYYVYVLNTADREEAIAEALRLRNESEFKDTWVYFGDLGKLKDGVQPLAGVDINPATSKAMAPIVAEPAPAPAEDKNALASNGQQTYTSSNASIATTVSTKDDVAGAAGATTMEEPDNDTELAGKKFYFELKRANDQQVVEGDVDVIDLDKVRKIGTYKGNMDVKVNKPSGKSGKVSLVCEVFGYRKAQREVDYVNPEGEDIKMTEAGTVSVPFELQRLQKGDVAIMYNVYFFKDAAVMRPESRYEVNSLLDMLKENPNYKIRIHGHTNGKANGKIIMLEKGNDNAFSLNNTKDGFGSAKKLSEERAAVIKDFLATNGVEASRMQIKAWGGKRPIHDKHSTRAQENVRVEIEILED